MLIPSQIATMKQASASLSRGMNANSQRPPMRALYNNKSIKRDEC